jgi:hypothetical protein
VIGYADVVWLKFPLKTYEGQPEVDRVFRGEQGGDDSTLYVTKIEVKEDSVTCSLWNNPHALVVPMDNVAGILFTSGGKAGTSNTTLKI